MEPFAHQLQGVEIARSKPRYGFFWKPGTGKTVLMLLVQRERPLRTLIVAPKSVHETAWMEDGLLCDVEVQRVWHKQKQKRLKLIRTPGNHVLLTNFEQFRMHYREFLETGVERLIIDESSKVKNRESKITAATIQFADHMKECYLLSGTPAPNCPTEFWSQLRILSPRAATTQFWKWAYHYFVPQRRTIQVRGKVRSVIEGWEFKPGRAESVFYERLREWTWSLMKEDCVDLPDKTDQFIFVDLHKREREVYDNLKNEMSLSVNGKTIGVHASGVNMKMRQVVGGAAKMGDEIAVFGSSKIDAIIESVEELGEEQVIIWSEFTHEINRIAYALNSAGKSYEIIDGRTKSIGQVVKDFRAKKMQCIIAHPKAAGHGTDGLQKTCSYGFYCSLSYSAEEHEQSRDRLQRSGQKNHTTYRYFIVPDSVDEGLLATVQEKCTRQEAILRELRKTG